MLFEQLVEVIDPEPHCAALNMAIDEALLRRAGPEPMLRVYRWARPAVSFGYFEKYAPVAAEWPQRELVRRWTGGGVVPHGEDVTYTLVVPETCALFRMPALESYRAIHECVARLMNGSAVLAESAAARQSSACFANAVRYDLLSGGRKIAGAAQRRTRTGMVHQGSVQGAKKCVGLREKLAPVFSDRIIRRSLLPEELAEAEKIADEKYATRSWMQRI